MALHRALLRVLPAGGLLVGSLIAPAVTAPDSMLSAALRAQAPPAPGPVFTSPEVQLDRRITFRVSAPKASEAVLRLSDGAPQSLPMVKGEDGVWSVTIGPVEPEIYTYSFLIDGVKTIDLANPIAKIAQHSGETAGEERLANAGVRTRDENTAHH